MRYPFLLLCLAGLRVAAQPANYEHRHFCTNLHQIFDSGTRDNFESVTATGDHVSPFLRMPGESMHLENFPVFYVDKDSRFVAKTNLTFDSLSAVKKLADLRTFVNACMDSTQWTWLPFSGDDSATVFFHEINEYAAIGHDLTLTLAMVEVAERAYTINLYIRKNHR